MSLWGVRLMVQDAGLINSLWEFDSLTPYSEADVWVTGMAPSSSG